MLSIVARCVTLCAVLFSCTASAVAVDFQLDAPKAKTVFLAGEMTDWDKAKVPMAKGTDGKWHVRLDLATGQWLYKFVVDGAWITDPVGTQNDADGQGGRHSYVFVGDGDWSARAGVPAGKVDAVAVPSKAWGHPVKLNVYLPPGFQRGQPYPVLLLLHGAGMDADQWYKTGQVHHFMDNLLAQDLIRPFVIVMPSSGTLNYTGVSERFLTEELPLWLKDRYGLSPNVAQSGVAGMSMGGFGAFHLALSHPDRFGIAIALSGFYPQDLLDKVPPITRLPFSFVQLCGTEDPLLGGNRALARALQARGVSFYYREDEGAHTFHYWNQRTPEMLVAAGAFFSRGYVRHNEDMQRLPSAESFAIRGQPVPVTEALWPRLIGKWRGEWILADGSARGRLDQTLTAAGPGNVAGRYSAYDTPDGDKSINVPFSGRQFDTVAGCVGCIRAVDRAGVPYNETVSEEGGHLFRQFAIQYGEVTVVHRLRKMEGYSVIPVTDALWARLVGTWRGEWIVDGSSPRGRMEYVFAAAGPGHAEGRYSAFGTTNGDRDVNVSFSSVVNAIPGCEGCIGSFDKNGSVSLIRTVSEEDDELWLDWKTQYPGATVFVRLRKVGE
ncbi:alpha/beta hydrolase-fold protein [Niveibacterium sp. 24ML]|uniref:alpha/beta hydrolase-fold protein n=1 Tax=Niveibacterium sp. 24ML TaxID=2985512 RepID=UPI00226F6749|nr:alpha/beta hydrolase-fold protein [Niveibacterium sp. 24ML]MCX9157928.1 alpha/beta hydrolase-fold protein [Niveibacterium sp. 24ML]